MIQKITNKIRNVQFEDMNKHIRTVLTYTWIGSGALFACYLYFVGAITFSVVKQQELARDIKGLISAMSTEELTYLSQEKNLTESYAQAEGFVRAEKTAFAAPRRAVAWNVGR